MSYPNFQRKHDHAALAEPDAFVKYWVDQGLLPADYAAPLGVVMLYQRRLFDSIVSSESLSPFAPRGSGNTAFLDLYLVDSTDGAAGVVGGFGIGAPAAVAILESLIALGVREFVTVGTAGALRPGLDAGDVIVCDRAVRDEGVSHHYLPSAMWAEPSSVLTERLRSSLEDAGLDPSTGSAWTIDAPFRETVVEARHYSDGGVAVVDMEAAAVFAVSQVRGVEVAAAFAISDSLANGEWVPQFGDPTVAERLTRMVLAAVRAVGKPD